MVKLLLKEVSHKFLAGLVQKLDFPRFRQRPFWKNVRNCVFERILCMQLLSYTEILKSTLIFQFFL